jgi:hypothetical protein
VGASGRGLDDRDGRRAPLSAKLAAYWGSLAPERRFREAKRKRLLVKCLRLMLLKFLRGMSLGE